MENDLPQIKNVRYLPSSDLPVDLVFEKAKDGNFESVSVLGWDRDGNFRMYTTHAKRAMLLWDVKMAEKVVME